MDHKQAALDFLKMVVAGEIDAAYQKYIDMNGKHHNPYTPAGFPALKKGMLENHSQFPDKKLMVQHAVAEGDMVSVHSRLALEAGKELSVHHLLRFEGDKIAEMWDSATLVSADSPNKDGMF